MPPRGASARSGGATIRTLEGTLLRGRSTRGLTEDGLREYHLARILESTVEGRTAFVRLTDGRREELGPCHVWQARLSRNGYGRYWYAGVGMVMVHRARFEIERGPIEGFARLQVDHLCRERRCCNPDHLEPISAEENNWRAHAGVIPAGSPEDVDAAGGVPDRAMRSLLPWFALEHVALTMTDDAQACANHPRAAALDAIFASLQAYQAGDHFDPAGRAYLARVAAEALYLLEADAGEVSANNPPPEGALR